MAVCCLPFISSGCKQSETAVKESSISDALYQNLPFEMPKVQQPVFPAYEVNIEKFGAKGDGLFLNTKAINDAIKDVNQRGGGKVIIPEGVWLTGPIELLSNVNLYTEQNALVLFTGDFEAYPIIATSFEGLETRRCQSPISVRNAENIAITGHGTFDGNGDCWRPVKKGKLTASQWKKLVNSGGVLDEKQEIWYPTAGSLRGAMACKDFNVPEGINTVIGTHGTYLSGGEQQRISIARAILKNAPILILDEATAFADPDNEAKVQQAINELAKDKTVIMIAHRLSTIANADKIYLLENGKIAESGTNDELVAKGGIYAKMMKNYVLSVNWKISKEGK